MVRDVIADFYHQLALLVESQCPLPECIERVSSSVPSRDFRETLISISDRLRQGDKLSELLAAYPQYFDALHVRLIGAAEKTDSLPDVLEAIAREARFEQLYIGKAREATLYPLFIVHLACALVLVVSTWFMPVYWEAFTDASIRGRSVGWAAQCCMNVSQAIQANATWLALLQGLALIVTFWLYLGGVGAHRATLRLLERFPGTSRILSAIDSARVCGLWKLFLDRHLPVAEALRSAACVVQSKKTREAIFRVAEGNERGEPLGKLMTQESAIDTLISMTLRYRPEDRLPQALEDLQNRYEQDVIADTRNAASLWTLIGMVIMASIVVGVALMVFIPVMSLPNTL
jgi:type II secretory pathway component PulF